VTLTVADCDKYRDWRNSGGYKPCFNTTAQDNSAHNGGIGRGLRTLRAGQRAESGGPSREPKGHPLAGVLGTAARMMCVTVEKSHRRPKACSRLSTG